MLGQIVYRAGSRGKVRLERGQAGGLTVLRAQLDPEGLWARRRLRRAARLLAGAGSGRVLVPEGFEGWEELAQFGLRPVDPLPFLRWCAPELMVAALEARGLDPARCAVALRGTRAEGELERCAMELCPRVRELCVSVPRGGEALRERLRWEYGVAARPDFPQVPGAVRFDRDTRSWGGAVLDLFPPGPDPAAVRVRLPELRGEETGQLPLMAALWESGKVEKGELEFT